MFTYHTIIHISVFLCLCHC